MNIRRLFSRRRIIWTTLVVVVIALIGNQIYRSKNDTSNIITETAKKQDLKQTVLATGQVTSNTDLALSFKGSGIVRRVNVKVGDVVRTGQLLANLDQRDQAASLTSARGSLASAQANYQRVLDGTSSEEVQVAQKAVDAAQVTLDNTKKQQDIAVSNSYRALLNTSLIAEPGSGNINDSNPTISGSYNGTAEGAYNLRQEGKSFYFSSGLEIGGNVNFSSYTAVPLGTKGLYITFPSDNIVSGDTWTVQIPNTKASNYVPNLNAYQAALENRTSSNSAAQAALDQAVASLNLKKAQARPADIKAAQAQILSAQGQVQSAQAALESTEIRAASSGTVTKVDVKVGELAGATTPVIVVQDVSNLYLEANISEANVASLKPGQIVDVTFDALGPESEHKATVSTIDPASNVVSGVVNYKIKALLEKVADIKPGMTANMSVLTGEKADIIAVPIRAVVSRDNKKYIRVITDSSKKVYTETEVTTGFEGDGGLIEIVSGINAGQEIVTFIDPK